MDEFYIATGIICVIVIMALLAYTHLERTYWYQGRRTDYEYPNYHFKFFAVLIMVIFAIIVLSK